MMKYGCLVTCMDMVLESHGVSVDPGKLVNWLSDKKAFTDGWMTSDGFTYLPQYPGAEKRDVVYETRKAFSWKDLDYWLEEQKCPVIVHVPWPSAAIGHWVVVSSHTRKEYGICDPYGKYTKLNQYPTPDKMLVYSAFQVISNDPINNSTDIPPSVTPSITFNRPLINYSAEQLKRLIIIKPQLLADAVGGRLPGGTRIEISEDKKQVFIRGGYFYPGKKYVISISGDLKSASGASLKEYPGFSFTIASESKGADIREWPGGHTPGRPGVGFSEMPSDEVAAKGPIDLIFCIDATGSMTDDIDQVKRDASNLVSRLRAKCPSLRIGLVTYRDFAVDGPRHLETNLPLTDDVDAILAAIRGITTAGGGDDPEDVLDGLQAAIDMDWRDGVAKFIILMGDAPAKDPDHEGKTKEMIAEAAFNVDPAHVYGLVLDDGGAVPEAALDSFKAIAELTGGKVYTVSNAAELSSAIENAVADAITEHPSEVGGLAMSSPDWETPLFISSLVSIFVLGIICISIVAVRRRSLPDIGKKPSVLAWVQIHAPDAAPYNTPITLPVWRIGRTRDNHLILADPRVSSHHAEIRLINSTPFIVDLDSVNGIQVNGLPMKKALLKRGDRVKMGNTVIIFFG